MGRIQDIYLKMFAQQKQNEMKHEYDGALQDDSGNRLAKILLKINALRSLDPMLIEELFFTNLIGSIQIENVIPHILELSDNCSNETKCRNILNFVN